MTKKRKVDYSKLITWKNGKAVNWNNKKILLSRMIPNGIKTGYKSDLDELGRTLYEIESGYLDEGKPVPVGIDIVREFCSYVSMISSCYVYFSMEDVKRGGQYYKSYQEPLIKLGLKKNDVEKEFRKLVSIMSAYYKKNAEVQYCTGTDNEGGIYHTLIDNTVPMNIVIHHE